MSRETLATPCLVVCVSLFAIGGTLVLLNVPFPTAYDELQHLSFIAALREAPTFFPHYGAYRVLNADLQGWTTAINYIAHPPLYYLLLAPLGDNVMLLRGINLTMATAGFALCAMAGLHILATTTQRLAFLALLLLFSKPALIAGMVNNDNLVLLETGVLFWLIAQDRPRPAALALILAAVGWTKFNAFVGMGLFVGLLHLRALQSRTATLCGRETIVLAAGILVGAIPTCANLLTLGAPAYVATDFLFVEPSMRAHYDVFAFVAAFWHKVGQKVLFTDGIADVAPILIAMMLLALCTPLARGSRARDIAISGTIATLAFAALHVSYGWNSFRTLGAMSDAQSRYYVMLWPVFALATIIGGTAVADQVRRWREGGKPAALSA